jgi:hypothetical protein
MGKDVKRKCIRPSNNGHIQNNSSYVKNTKTKHEWAFLIKEITNPMIVGQKKNIGRSAGSPLNNINEDVDPITLE